MPGIMPRSRQVGVPGQWSLWMLLPVPLLLRYSAWRHCACGTAGGSRRRWGSGSGPGWRACCSPGTGRVPWLFFGFPAGRTSCPFAGSGRDTTCSKSRPTACLCGVVWLGRWSGREVPGVCRQAARSGRRSRRPWRTRAGRQRVARIRSPGSGLFQAGIIPLYFRCWVALREVNAIQLWRCLLLLCLSRQLSHLVCPGIASSEQSRH